MMRFLPRPVARLSRLEADLAHPHSLNDEIRLLRKQDDVNIAEPGSSQRGCQLGWRRRVLYCRRRTRQEKLSVISGRVASQPMQSYFPAGPQRTQRFGHQLIEVYGVTPRVEASFKHHFCQRVGVMGNSVGESLAQTMRPDRERLRYCNHRAGRCGRNGAVPTFVDIFVEDINLPQHPIRVGDPELRLPRITALHSLLALARDACGFEPSLNVYQFIRVSHAQPGMVDVSADPAWN